MKKEKVICCPHCGRELMFRDSVCPYCGQELKTVLTRGKRFRFLRQKGAVNPERKRESGSRTAAGVRDRIGLMIATCVCLGVVVTVLQIRNGQETIQQAEPAVAETIPGVIILPPMEISPLPTLPEEYYSIPKKEYDALDEQALWRHRKKWPLDQWGLTRRQLKAAEAIASDAKTWHDSKAEQIEDARRDGYSQRDINAAMKVLNIDYRIQAQKAVLSYLGRGYYGPGELRRQLENAGFTPEEIDYGLKHCQVDWNVELRHQALELLEIRGFSRWELTGRLKEMGYNSQDIEQQLDDLDIDWEIMAYRRGLDSMEIIQRQHNALIVYLEEEGYTFAEAAYAADHICG